MLELLIAGLLCCVSVDSLLMFCELLSQPHWVLLLGSKVLEVRLHALFYTLCCFHCKIVKTGLHYLQAGHSCLPNASQIELVLEAHLVQLLLLLLLFCFVVLILLLLFLFFFHGYN